MRAANLQSGTMKVVPGTQKLGFIEHDTSDPARPVIPSEVLSGREEIIVDLPGGDGVLFDPLLVHSSVPAKTESMKYVLLVQVQDLTTLADPEDPSDPLPARLEMTRQRDTVRNK